MSTLCVAIMVKNEENYISKTLNSVNHPFINNIYILDTGSMDGTVEEILKWCNEHKKNLHLTQSEFVDFATSRNQLLDYVETNSSDDFILLLDANDELVIHEDFIFNNVFTDDVNINGFWTRYHLQHEDVHHNIHTVKCIRRNSGWRYVEPIHEFLDHPSPHLHAIQTFHIYQDRINDGGKSYDRYNRDYKILKRELETRPDNGRLLYYMARTCGVLEKTNEAITHFIKRTQIKDGGNCNEELFWSHVFIGRYLMNNSETMNIAISHFLESLTVMKRVEPIVDIVQIYMKYKWFYPAYLLIRDACMLPVPERTRSIVEMHVYDYNRWHLLGACAYYVQDWNTGILACKKALEYKENECDRYNLDMYSSLLDKNIL